MNQKEDMREMIRREIQSISAIEERVAFKNLIEFFDGIPYFFSKKRN